MPEFLQHLPVPTLQQMIFAPLAIFVAGSALLAAVARNLFHSALGLVATLFGVAGLYFMLEAEFVGVSQVLVYVGAIATLITFAIMLTRGMMFGETAQLNRQALASALIASLFFLVVMGIIFPDSLARGQCRLGRWRRNHCAVGRALCHNLPGPV